MTGRARELLGFEGSHQRYPDIESVREFEEVSDPTAVEDESASSIREWIADNTVTAISFGLLATFLIALMLAFGGKYLPLIIGNRWVQLGAILSGVFVFGRRNGWKANQKRLGDIDELHLQLPDHQKSFRGVIIEGGTGVPPAFIAVKGYRKPGMRPQPYTVADIDPGALERADGRVDPDAPAVIRLQSKYTTVTDTDTGKRAVQLASGIDPDPDAESGDGRLTVLVASAPDIADKEKVRKINNENSRLLEKKKNLKNQLQEKDQTVRRLREEVHEPVKERVDEYLQNQERLMYASRGQKHPDDRTSSDDRKITTSGTDKELEQVAEEVSADD